MAHVRDLGSPRVPAIGKETQVEGNEEGDTQTGEGQMRKMGRQQIANTVYSWSP